MNTNLINSQFGNTEKSQAREATSLFKLLVFNMGSLNFALPIKSVHKVLKYTPVYGSGVQPVGVTHLGDSEVTVVDLHRRFFKSSQTSVPNSSRYLVIVKNITGELYGIPVAYTPSLVEVPSSEIRILPESYRRADTLDVASHVAVIPHETTPLTVFLLDVNLLLPIFQELAIIN